MAKKQTKVEDIPILDNDLDGVAIIAAQMGIILFGYIIIFLLVTR